jgi:hypothetical protein
MSCFAPCDKILRGKCNELYCFNRSDIRFMAVWAAVKSKTSRPFWVLAIMSCLVAIAFANVDDQTGMWISIMTALVAWCIGIIISMRP